MREFLNLYQYWASIVPYTKELWNCSSKWMGTEIEKFLYHPKFISQLYSHSISHLLLLCVDHTSYGGLRQVVIPTELISKFLNLASTNTRKNLETCGILAGRLVKASAPPHCLYFCFWYLMLKTAHGTTSESFHSTVLIENLPLGLGNTRPCLV